jgi:signal transduction histidine kinase
MLEIRNVSGDVVEILGLEAKELIGSPSSLKDQIFAQDIELFEEQLQLFGQRGEISLTHRFRHRNGLPVRVIHRLRALEIGPERLVRGCFLAVANDFQGCEWSSRAAERFVHKLGNQFTLLQMIANSMKRDFPACRDVDVLHEALENTIDLTRSFSALLQTPSQTPETGSFFEILDRAVMRIKWALRDKGIVLEEQIDRALQRFSLEGDAALLELALGEILINAVEASAKNGKVVIAAAVQDEVKGIGIVAICVQDFGHGIAPKELGRAFQPFFTTKAKHAGLGLNRARRFVEHSGGFLHMTSSAGCGTRVELRLPASAIVSERANTKSSFRDAL